METLYASFDNAVMAQKAVGAMLDHGVAEKDLTLLANVAQSECDPAAAQPMEHAVQSAKEGISTTTINDAGAGMLKGAGVGLGLGVLGALVSLFIPGFGLVTGGSALAMALTTGAATAAGGAMVGGVTGYLVDQGVPSDIAQDLEKDHRQGGAIIAVKVPLRGPGQIEIEKILRKYLAGRIAIRETSLSPEIVAEPEMSRRVFLTTLPVKTVAAVLDGAQHQLVAAQLPSTSQVS